MDQNLLSESTFTRLFVLPLFGSEHSTLAPYEVLKQFCKLFCIREDIRLQIVSVYSDMVSV